MKTSTVEVGELVSSLSAAGVQYQIEAPQAFTMSM